MALIDIEPIVVDISWTRTHLSRPSPALRGMEANVEPKRRPPDGFCQLLAQDEGLFLSSFHRARETERRAHLAHQIGPEAHEDLVQVIGGLLIGRGAPGGGSREPYLPVRSWQWMVSAILSSIAFIWAVTVWK